MQQPLLLCLLEEYFFPLRNGRASGSVATSAPRQSILQNSRRVPEQALILFALGANIEADL